MPRYDTLSKGKHKIIAKDYLSPLKSHKTEKVAVIKETTLEGLRNSNKRKEHKAGSRDPSTLDTQEG